MSKNSVLRRTEKLHKLNEKILKNLGEDDDEILINAVGLIKDISRTALALSLKICEERELKNRARKNDRI